MAKLFTGHDRFHIHAVLGLTALLHFCLRFAILLTSGRDSFSPCLASAGLLAVHFLLHATSFQFDLPEKRMRSKPMIWREFRVHNAIFAYRNLVCAVLGIWLPDWWYRAGLSFSAFTVKIGVLCMTCWAAEKATERLGSKEDRTTNAMPYPDGVPKNVEATIKKFYAKSQFAASALAAFGTPMLSFGSVFAIEIASFLMTLVRKGKIDSWAYHAAYAASLFIMFPALVATLYFSGDPEAEMATFRALIVMRFAVDLRIKYRFSRYAMWVLSSAVGCIVAAGMAGIMSTLGIKVLALCGMLWSVMDTLRILYRTIDHKASDEVEKRSSRKGCPFSVRTRSSEC
eukprot:TRINITY_DN5473_c0_g1_i1.p1 TRINITY_DN5473_c0_g1~~TRINITY_DN5473_c0_g1_i1.p1  ORF type:complete len:360 (-),score=39.81 TRINITY_DN5473_c0_g1_i1:50-1075(-)